MAINKYQMFLEEKYPIIKELQLKYNEMYLFGDLDENCEKFGVHEKTIRRLIYPTRKLDFHTLNFDTIIRLSNMFDIPYEEFINYNATIDYYRNMIPEDIEEEDKMLKQYTVGKEWEDTIIKYYNDKKYFVYKIPTMNNGTVFDIIVVKNGACLMIEAKHTEGDKLYYKGSGLIKKRDELDHFVSETGNNVYIYIKSEKCGTYWTTWVKARPILEEKGFVRMEECYKCELERK